MAIEFSLCNSACPDEFASRTTEILNQPAEEIGDNHAQLRKCNIIIHWEPVWSSGNSTDCWAIGFQWKPVANGRSSKTTDFHWNSLARSTGFRHQPVPNSADRPNDRSACITGVDLPRAEFKHFTHPLLYKELDENIIPRLVSLLIWWELKGTSPHC
ncbi:hypothetical protein K438DRAFT_1781629 [Mycena galopus ATCC 62051]|nr:hypothetical protein K438DRAFT_1781629 [Mycena galopus ATCC 62051]